MVDEHSEAPATAPIAPTPFALAVEAIVESADPRALMAALSGPVGEWLDAYAVTTRTLEGGRTARHDWVREDRYAGFFDEPLEDLVFEAQGEGESVVHIHRAVDTGLLVALIGAPLVDSDGLGRAAIGAAVPVPSEEAAAALVDELEALIATAALSPVWSARREPRSLVPDDPKIANADRLGRYESTTALAFAITNGLANRLECEQVALATPVGGRLELLSISGQEQVRTGSPAVARLLGAMEEALDLGRTTLLPAPEGQAELERPLLLSAWLDAEGGSVAVIPVVTDLGQTAVVALRRAPGLPLSAQDLAGARRLVEPYVPGLDLLRRARRGLFTHLRESAVEELGRLRRGRARAVAVGAAAAAVLWFCFGSLPFRVHAPATVRTDDVRQVAAPFDGRLRAAPFVAGDRVLQGDLLAVFDTSFQELELAHLEAQLAGLEVDLAASMAADDGLAQRRLALEVEGLEAQAELLRTRIASAEIRAPFDGVVLAGDVRDRIGDTLTRGEPLFEVAPPTGLWLEVEVPEGDALAIDVEQVGSFAARARPEVRIPLEVRGVGAALDAREGRGALRVTADLERVPEWLRSGMSGTARVEVGERTPWRLVFGDLVDALRMRFGR